MIKHQLPDTRFDQISDHKPGICLYGKLCAKLIAQAPNKNTKFLFTKTELLKYGFRRDCPEKFKTNTSVGLKSNFPETCYGILECYFESCS